MATVTCPKCGTENPATAMNCMNCRINLQYALEHRDEIELARQHRDVLEPTEQQAGQGTLLKPMSRKQARKRKGLTFLAIAIGCFFGDFLVLSAGGGPPASQASALAGGTIAGLLGLATLICFFAGIISLIGGSVGKE
jgi:hypothetical protein